MGARLLVVGLAALAVACSSGLKPELVALLGRNVPASGGPGDAKRGAAFHFCGWKSSQGEADLRAMVPGLSWYYNWSSRPLDCADGNGVGDSELLTQGVVEFVPMAWGLMDDGRDCDAGGSCFRVDVRSGGKECHSVCHASFFSFDPAGDCYACYHDGISRDEFLADVPDQAKFLLGYNEPNFKQQANLTPEAAARGWRHLEWIAERKNLRLVGPSTNFCDPTPGANHPGACIEAVDGDNMLGFAWLERFYDACSETGAAGRACQIDFQAAHAYGCGSVFWMIEAMKAKAGLKEPRAEHCANGLQDEDEFGVDCGGNVCAACTQHARDIFAKPVWLTEFATVKGDCGAEDRTVLDRNTMELLAVDLPRFESDPYVFRYAWFMPKVSMPNLDHADLLVEDEAGVLSPLGQVYFGRLAFSE